MKQFATTRENRLAATSQHASKVDHLQVNPLDHIRNCDVALKAVEPTTANKSAGSTLQKKPVAGIRSGANFKPVEAKQNKKTTTTNEANRPLQYR
jgi:hypothetical protein